MVKDVLNPYGHEFSQLIPLSTPMHVTDARWRADGEWCRESLLSLVDSMDLDGVFRTMKTDQFGFPYGHYCEWALWGYWLVHRDNAFIRDVLPAFQKNVQGTWALFSDGQDDLQIAYNHRRTGKEYQPSYWYFRGYPDNAGDEDSYDWLKRVDLSVYLYQNARGIERLCAALDDPPKKEFADLADRLEQQVLCEMWDEGTGFFYDLHHKTGQKAMVKNVVGIYPLWAQITDQRHLRVIDAMLDSRQFSTGSGLASVSRQCPAYRPQGSWKGHFLKGRDGCMWARPSWPYTTAIALEAIALQSRRFGHRYDDGFTRLLREYSWQHFRHQNLHEPYLVEHYNAETGEMLSDEPDYNHSFYIDLIIRQVAGLEPTEDGFEVEPLETGLEWFRLERVMLRGHRVDISYRLGEGMKVLVDGKCVCCDAVVRKYQHVFED